MATDRAFHYAAQKFYEAVRLLACGRAPLQQRVGAAALYVTTLQERDVPPDLRERFLALVERLTIVEPRGDEGSIAATAREMSEDDAERLAEEIVSLFMRVAPDFW